MKEDLLGYLILAYQECDKLYSDDKLSPDPDNPSQQLAIAGCAWNEFMNVWAFLGIVISSFISGMAIELIRREND